MNKSSVGLYFCGKHTIAHRRCVFADNFMELGEPLVRLRLFVVVRVVLQLYLKLTLLYKYITHFFYTTIQSYMSQDYKHTSSHTNIDMTYTW